MLTSILKTVLNTLAMLSSTPDSFSLHELSKSLKVDDNIPEEVTRQIMEWFGQSTGDGSWQIKLGDVAREIGKEMLATQKVHLIRFSLGFIGLHTYGVFLYRVSR